MKKHIKLSIMVILTFSMLMASPTVVDAQIRPVITIGALGPLDITPGNDMQKGARLAVEEINGGTGIVITGGPYDFDLLIETTSGTTGLPDAATAGLNIQTLLTDGVVAMLGGFRTEVVLGAVQPAINSSKTPFLGVGSTAPIITEYFYRVGPVNGTTLARNLIGFYLITMAAKGVSNIVIVREQAAWTEAIGAAVNSTLSIGALLGSLNFTVGADIVISEAATGTDVANAMNSLVGNTDVDALLTLFSAPVGREVTVQWDALGLSESMYLAGINVEAQKSGHFLGTDGSAEGEIDFEAAPPGENPTSKTAAFRDAYSARWGEEPTYTSFASYDSVYIIKEAIERADAFTPAAIHAELPNTDYLGTSAKIKFTNESTAGQVASPAVPDSFKKFNDSIAHDLFTTSTVGVSGLPYSQPYFAQWQANGLKKAVWQTSTTGFAAINAPPYLPETATVSVTDTNTVSVTDTNTVSITDTDTITNDAGLNLYLMIISTMFIATYISRIYQRKR